MAFRGEAQVVSDVAPTPRSWVAVNKPTHAAPIPPVTMKPELPQQLPAEIEIGGKDAPAVLTSERGVFEVRHPAPPMRTAEELKPAPLTVAPDTPPADLNPQASTVPEAFVSVQAEAEPALSRPDALRHIATQIAPHTHRLAQGATEIQLSPVELGKVILSVSTSETSVVLSVTAERPETMELMRRHVDQLQQEFRSLGYESIQLSVNGREAGGRNQRERTVLEVASLPSASAQVTESATAAYAPASRLGGMDLRL